MRAWTAWRSSCSRAHTAPSSRVEGSSKSRPADLVSVPRSVVSSLDGRGRRLSAAALVAGGLLPALAAFAGISAAWAPSTERALDDFCRTLLYSGVFVVVALSASRRSRGRWLDGLALGITAVAAVALVSRFFPSSFGSGAVLRLGSGPVWRLSFPVGYWNGLAVMVALGVPLLLGAALMPRHALLRGLALTPLPAFPALICLTSVHG